MTSMFRCSDIVWVVVVTSQFWCSVVSEHWSSEFELVPVQVSLSYGTSLSREIVYSQLECCVRCGKDLTCKSLMYHHSNRLCDTNTDTLALANLGTGNNDSNIVTYAEKVMCVSTMKANCSQKGDCADVNSVCTDGICKCIMGYHYNRARCECVTECASNSYGTIYQEYDEIAIAGYNELNIYDITLDECKATCEDPYLNITCRTVEFEHNTGRCILSWKTPEPSIIRIYPSKSLYVRDCA